MHVDGRGLIIKTFQAVFNATYEGSSALLKRGHLGLVTSISNVPSDVKCIPSSMLLQNEGTLPFERMLRL
jgi:hypothetical protein